MRKVAHLDRKIISTIPSTKEKQKIRGKLGKREITIKPLKRKVRQVRALTMTLLGMNMKTKEIKGIILNQIHLIQSH